MAVNASVNAILLLQEIQNQISLYIPLILLSFGTCGCLCNFLTFTSKQLKRNSYTFYCLCIAIIELPTTYFGLISRLAGDHLGSTLFNTNSLYCKIRSYLIITLPSLISYMIVITTIDRFMSAQPTVRYRSFSQLKVAHRTVAIVVLISMISSSHILIFFDLYPSCTAKPGLYSIVYTVYLFVWTGLLPNGFMILFSLLTIRNAMRIKRRVVSALSIVTRAQRVESQLIAMMFGQAILSSCLDLTRISFYIYFIVSANIPKSTAQQVIDGFLLQLTIILLYVNCSKSFYTYTLASTLFRDIFRRSIRRHYRKIVSLLRRNHELDQHANRIKLMTKN